MGAPVLDLEGFKRRATNVRPEDVDQLEANYPGFVATQIEERTSYVYARLRKRYGNAGGNSAIPFGRSAPPLDAVGTNPPPVTLTGVPTLGSLQVRIRVATAGALGAGAVQFATDGGTTPESFGSAVTLAAALPIPGTGLTANFPAGTYGADNAYGAPTPVPSIIVAWLVAMVSIDVWDRRGRNAQDPLLESAQARLDQTLAELKEAADSKEGLFDLPVNEDADSAVTTGGPKAYSETSPYVWQRLEAIQGRAEDIQGGGTTQ